MLGIAMPYRTTPKMAARKQAHRDRLLNTATRLFGRDGYHATTVPRIVAESGSSTGSFYFYFRNKEDIFAAVLESLATRLAQEITAAITSAGREPYAHMRAAVHGLVRFLGAHPAEARILIVESSGLGGRLEELRRRVIASHARGVEEALKALESRIPPGDVAVLARCWVGAAYEAVYAWLEQPAEKRLPPDVVAETVAGFNLRGIGAPAARRRH